MKLVYLEACVTKLTFGIHTIGLNFYIHTNGMCKRFKTLKLFPKVKIINLGETLLPVSVNICSVVIVKKGICLMLRL